MLYKKLVSYSKQDYYPMHMPGHKRNTKAMHMGNPYAIDITEIHGFDNLHQAEGILMQLSDRISNLFGAGKSFPMVNGSTAGILAGISAATKRGDTVLVARNCHKSVYHALAIKGLNPIYIYPDLLSEIPIYGGICPNQLEELFKMHPEATMVMITSPTYEGIVSDIATIAEVVHRNGALLFVDEAHGAHFGFHAQLPQSAIKLGADIVVQSLHKTLPAFTQTAVLHCNRIELVHKISKYLAMYQSSSPSYLLLAGIDKCIGILEENAHKLFEEYIDGLTAFYNRVSKLDKMSLLNKSIIKKNGEYDFDISKLVITLSNTEYSGHELSIILREKHHVVMEMDASEYILGMTGLCDTKEGFDRLGKALLSIDSEAEGNKKERIRQSKLSVLPIQFMSLSEALEKEPKEVKLAESKNQISAAFVSLFPPGAPILLPGEVITKEFLEYIDQAKSEGLTITGLSGDNRGYIEVI